MALGHVFNGEKMWNGYDARLVDSNGAQRNGIEKVKDKMVGRGVLLDVARHKGVDSLEDGCGIGTAELEQMRRRAGRAENSQGRFCDCPNGAYGTLPQGQQMGKVTRGRQRAPACDLETAEWIRSTDIAAICADTWGCEVRPNETGVATQPWHWVVIPMIGISMGEIFYLKDLAEDCAQDHVYEFFFCAPPLPITRAVGSPVNPIAVK